jgi:hypothetical protein
MAARDADSLGAVMSFFASGAPGCARFRAGEIFGARELVAAVIDHVVA